MRSDAAPINACDALSSSPLSRAQGTHAGQPRCRRVSMEFAHLLQRTTEGQATELAWIAEGHYDLDDGDYLALIREKTCWYSTVHPLRIGALIGSRGRADIDRLNDFGFYLGAVFQIHDDIENLQAGPGYGRTRSATSLGEAERALLTPAPASPSS